MTTASLWHSNTKAAMDNVYMHGSDLLNKFYLQKQAMSWIGFIDFSLLTLALDDSQILMCIGITRVSF